MRPSPVGERLGDTTVEISDHNRIGDVALVDLLEHLHAALTKLQSRLLPGLLVGLADALTGGRQAGRVGKRLLKAEALYGPSLRSAPSGRKRLDVDQAGEFCERVRLDLADPFPG